MAALPSQPWVLALPLEHWLEAFPEGTGLWQCHTEAEAEIAYPIPSEPVVRVAALPISESPSGPSSLL